jgi:hypothetical protein
MLVEKVAVYLNINEVSVTTKEIGDNLGTHFNILCMSLKFVRNLLNIPVCMGKIMYPYLV